MDSSVLNLGLTPIQQFYSNSKIFITGASGFFGKILLEKLLRSCPNVSTIYILVREKRGKNVKTRVKEILEDVPFERLKTELPNFREKIIGLDGDCSLPNLGLSSEDIMILKREVNIIFHLAATVNLAEKLKTATFINIRATKDLLHLASEMPYLKVMLHISTAFANSIPKVVEEKIYPPAFDGNMIITMAENLSDNIFDKISNTLVGEYPNTYTFTKQIAETILKEHGIGLPIGIHRPAMVVSTYKEPIKAWINNTYTATGVMAYIGMGAIRTAYGSAHCKTTAVPVDMCVNSMLAAAWDIGTTYETAKMQEQKYEIPVYHYESNNDQPIEWRKFFEKSLKYTSETPSSKAQWFPFFIIQSNVITYNILFLVLHFLPAFVFDLISFCSGRSPTMVKMYTKVYEFIGVLSYFSIKNWIFSSNNIRILIDKMSVKDREIYFCNLKQLNWDEFLKTYFHGIRLYILKDPDDTLPEAKKKFRRLYWSHRVISIAMGLFFLSMLLYLLTKISI